MTDEKNDAQESEGESPAANNVSSQDARAEKPNEETRKPVASQPPPLWPLGVATIFAAFFVVLVLWIIFRPRADVWTDDAYVTAHIALIAPRISGQVTSVEVDDNQQVKAGQVLVTLDPRDYETAVAAAQAAVERDKAEYADASATLARQPPIIEEQEGNAAAARARLAFAEHDARRFGNLAQTGAGTIQQQQQADTNLQESRAQLQSATASLEAAKKQLDVIRAQQQSAKAAIMVDVARLAQAKLNLSYTRILARSTAWSANERYKSATSSRPARRSWRSCRWIRPLSWRIISKSTSCTCARGRRSRSASTPTGSISKARWTASHRPPAPLSRRSSRTTPPAISRRSCSACRSRSPSIRTSRL